MKIQIDTKAKTIKIDETVKFEDLLKVLNKLLPKEWKSYSLETGTVIQWTNPVYWHYYDNCPVIPSQPWRVGDVWYSTGNPIQELPLTTSVYNVECSIN